MGTKLLDYQKIRCRVDNAPEIETWDVTILPSRVWVIGNGPSLKAEDLTKLHELGETCIAVNRIHLIYDQTPWRPDAWCFGDFARNSRWADDLVFHANQGYPCYVKDLALTNLSNEFEGGVESWIDMPFAHNIVPLIECFHDFIELRPPHKWHPPYLCAFGGSLNIALQVAINQSTNGGGVFLLGVDGNQKPYEIDEKEWKQVDPNHFSEQYTYLGPGAGPLTKRLVERIKAEAVLYHRLAAREAKLREIKLINASRYTELEVHPKDSFDRIIGMLE
jgi:hypothetical protein